MLKPRSWYYKMTYGKYHALGNDYIVIDPNDAADELDREKIRLICHRNKGLLKKKYSLLLEFKKVSQVYCSRDIVFDNARTELDP